MTDTNPLRHSPVDLTTTKGRRTQIRCHGGYNELVTLASAELVEDEVRNFARFTLSRKLARVEATLVPILEGASEFSNDLTRYLGEECAHVARNSFLASKYGAGTIGGTVNFRAGQLNPDLIRDKHVVVCDDICDSGETVKVVVGEIESLKPKAITTVFLTRKVGKLQMMEPDFWLFELDPSVWAVGHGMDLQFKYRHLRGIFDSCVDNYDKQGNRTR
jgi:hypoxanthine phosphoribosyltransferase